MRKQIQLFDPLPSNLEERYCHDCKGESERVRIKAEFNYFPHFMSTCACILP